MVLCPSSLPSCTSLWGGSAFCIRGWWGISEKRQKISLTCLRTAESALPTPVWVYGAAPSQGRTEYTGGPLDGNPEEASYADRWCYGESNFTSRCSFRNGYAWHTRQKTRRPHETTRRVQGTLLASKSAGPPPSTAGSVCGGCPRSVTRKDRRDPPVRRPT